MRQQVEASRRLQVKCKAHLRSCECCYRHKQAAAPRHELKHDQDRRRSQRRVPALRKVFVHGGVSVGVGSLTDTLSELQTCFNRIILSSYCFL